MRLKNAVSLLTFIIIFFSNISPVNAGLILSEGHVQLATSKIEAAIFKKDNTQTIIESIEFTYNPTNSWNPVLLLATPSRPEVEIFKDNNFFINLQNLTQNNFSKKSFLSKLIYPDIYEEKFKSPPTFSRPVSIVAINVFDPQSPESLATWIRENSYVLPKNSQNIISKYQNNGWYFITLNLDLEHTENKSRDKLLVNQGHSVPIKLKFNTQNIIFPQFLTSIEPDYDSLETPFIERWYGSTLENLGAQKDEKIDLMLSKPSQYKYPQLPLDLVYLKTDLYVFDNHKTDASGFTTLYADKVSAKKFNIQTETSKPWLTKLTSFTPFIQLKDVTLKTADDSIRVNPFINLSEKIIRTVILIFITLLIVKRLFLSDVLNFIKTNDKQK